MLDLRTCVATGLASLVALLALAALAVFILSERRLERRYDVQPEDVVVRDDPALAGGVSTIGGKLVKEAVARMQGLTHASLTNALRP